ncbi:hypothetical protein MTO96_032289, partial [Rhipicephalus appendiculatus]
GQQKTTTAFAFLNIQTRGDLSSLQWYESPLKYASVSSSAAKDGMPCEVYYAPLNFRDVLLATGKMAPEAAPGKWTFSDCAMGLEFSGRDSQGRRVMCMAPSHAIATVAIADQDFTWEVPETWSLKEACTVPTAYSTAYYALIMRGNMRPGETVLVHSGSGGVGQAAITVALSMGCTVYTTVGSTEKREFLKRRFPELEDRHFASSRDTSFEAHILSETKGKGVNLVLNSLAKDKVQASARCLADHGRFLEIGDLDLSKSSPLSACLFNRNFTFHAIKLNRALESEPFLDAEKRRLFEMVRDGIASGVVRPLHSIQFARDKAEEAFRFMASGKHIGKVVIQIRPEESHRQANPARPLEVEAMVRTHFHEHKSYVIAGGLGGFGLGARRLDGDSWMPQAAAHLTLGVEYRKADVSADEAARTLIEEAAAMGPVGGIFNLAMVLSDALLENQTVEAFEAVCKAESSRYTAP